MTDRKARNEEIAKLRREGVPRKIIAEKFDLCEMAIYFICKRLGAAPPKDRFRCGHLRTPENTYNKQPGKKVCLICKRKHALEYYHRSHGPCELEKVWKS